MAIHPSFPKSPYEILDPEYRWFPADESLRQTSYDKLIPPLVSKIRKEVKDWRDNRYQGASTTSKALLYWWFQKLENHSIVIVETKGLEDMDVALKMESVQYQIGLIS